MTQAHGMSMVIQRQPSRAFLRNCALVSKLTAKMLASHFQGLETCARHGLCIRGVCGTKDDGTGPFLDSLDLLCMLGAHITMPYRAGILNYWPHIYRD